MQYPKWADNTVRGTQTRPQFRLSDEEHRTFIWEVKEVADGNRYAGKRRRRRLTLLPHDDPHAGNATP